MAYRPLVALVGRPNVGKSTLFNRLVGQRLAVTDEIPGTTRDRLIGEADWRGVIFNIVDTGGIEVYQPKGNRDTAPLAEGSIDFVEQIKAQALLAIEEADVVVMVVDSQHGITAADEEIAEILRQTSKPILVAANKADSHSKMDVAIEFYALGVGEVFSVSAIHGLGTGDLLDAMVNSLQKSTLPDFAETDDEQPKFAIVGHPNTGKSTLLNCLLGEERAIVSPIAGTTRDAIDTQLRWREETITLIDTAGIRRPGKIEPGVEKYSVLRAIKAIERADVVLLLIDALAGVTEQDEHIAGYVLDSYKGVVIIVNKWDAVEKDAHTMNEFTRQIRKKLHFVPYAPILFISALTGQRAHQVLETANRVYQNRFVRIQTADLNRLLREAVANHPPPEKGGKRLKIYLGSQVAVAPPVFLFHVNDKSLAHFGYRRYLENQIRAEYPFEGTPIRLSFRERKSK